MSQQDQITEIESVSSAKAVLLGALAPGVNGQSWNVLKMVFLMLGLCLVAMFSFAFTSRDCGLILHVLFLGVLAIGLFVLLSRFLEQTGLVTVEHQMQEMGLIPKDTPGSDKNK
ncbi:hypothetical protein Droror1_Dr00010404 [Drosera rotundifolia]